MEEEYDKELMKIRLETLKTMVGKLEQKNKNKKINNASSKPSKHEAKDQVSSTSWSNIQSLRSTSNTSHFKRPGTPSYVTTPRVNSFSSSTKHVYVNPRIQHNVEENLQKTNQINITPKTSTKHNIQQSQDQLIISKHKFVRRGKNSQDPPSYRAASKFVFNKNSNIEYRPPNNNATNNSRMKGEPPQYPTKSMSASKDMATIPGSKTKFVKKYSLVNNVSSNDPIRTEPHKQSTYTSRINYQQSFSKYKFNKTQPCKETKAAVNMKWSQTTGFSSRRPGVVYNRFKIVKNKAPLMSYASRAKSFRQPTFTYNRYIQKRSFAMRRSNYLKNLSSYQARPTISTNTNPTTTTTKPNDLVLSRHGSNYLVSSNMKSLRRLSRPSSESSKKKETTSSSKRTGRYKYQRSFSNSNRKKVSSSKQVIASQVLKKSRNLTAVQRKKVNKDKYCLFYNRYGQCKRGEKCHFVHDPQKVAVCTRFLRGTCKDEKCLFSHKVDPNKMPVCSYFLLGECTKDDCPYRHVNVNESAEVCQNFVKGYCPQGDKCTKKHVLDCVEFTATGKCSKGKACKLAHRAGRRKRQRSISGLRRPRGFSKKRLKEDPVPLEGHSETLSPLKIKGKNHLLPKFISDKINGEGYEAARVLSSFRSAASSPAVSDVEMSIDDERPGPSTQTTDDQDFIPITASSSSDDDDDDNGHTRRRFSLTERDFISLE